MKRFVDKKKTFKNKKILIAGGAGSIGSILAIKLLEYDVKEIVIIDNNEYSIHRFKRLEFDKNKITIKFLSIMNQKELEKNFKRYKFDIVYNCAAIKHVDIAEDNKEETHRVNVIGTRNIVALSKKYKVKQIVFISSDKAFYPKGVMGKTKLKAEKEVLKINDNNLKTKVLRFPNVLFSSGSLLEIINESILTKSTFFLKDKNLKRFFIFKKDTLEFILRATELNLSNKIIVLNNVKEVKILKLLNNLKKFYKLKIKISKLPKYEKISEVYSDFSSKNKFFL